MMKIINRVVLFLVVFVLFSCYTRRSTNLLQERKSLPQYSPTAVTDYVLQPNDELVIRVITNNASLQYMFPFSSTSGRNINSYRIFEDGTADFPYITRVPLAGKTVKEAEAILCGRLKEFADDVEVKLALKNQTFCVIGEAGRGYFPIYKERLNIFQALAMAGGIGDGAAFGEVKIIRQTEKGTVVKTFDIRTKSIIDSEFYYIQPNDVIYVDVAKRKFWMSENLMQFVGLITSSITLLVVLLTVK